MFDTTGATKPRMVHPLTVAYQRTCKRRLCTDVRFPKLLQR